LARHARQRSRLRQALTVLGVVLVLLAGTASAGAVVVASKLRANLTVEDVSAGLGANRPATAAPDTRGRRPLNILLIGSDTRSGSNGFIGGRDDGARSDVTILLHLSADRRRAVGVSIPRDSMVEMPDCVRNDGGTRPGAFRMFADAFQIGGSACVQRTVESLTGIRVDHHVVVDFNGFRRMVDALGRVEVCVPKAVDDKKGNIKLAAGRQQFNGDQALDYVRLRRGLDDTGDIGRMERQQEFLGAMIRKATSAGILANPTRLVPFLDAATKSLTLDPGLANLNRLRELAQQVNGIGLDHINFLTVPFQTYEPDPNRIVWDEKRAQQLWQLIAEDRPLPGERATSPTPTPSATPSAPPAVRVPVAPGKVRVRVLDGSGDPALTQRAAADLRRIGFDVVGTGDAGSSDFTQTVVQHDPEFDKSGRTLAAAVPGAAIETDAELSRTLVLIVGSDYTGARAVTAGPGGSASTKPSPPPAPFETRTAAKAAAC
jgi:LCP family protein required for cell wall assembly